MNDVQQSIFVELDTIEITMQIKNQRFLIKSLNLYFIFRNAQNDMDRKTLSNLLWTEVAYIKKS